MAFSGGVFSLVSGNPVTTATTISSTWANNTLSDIATNGLSMCLLKDGSQTLTGNIPMGAFKLTGLGAGNSSGDSLRYEQVNGVVTTAGDGLIASGAGAFSRAPLVYSKQIYGITYVNNAGDATNDIDFNVGGCADSTGAAWINCAALTKRLDANWAAGTNQGMRNSAAAITDTGYYLWAVSTASGTQDYYAHTSATAATVLTALQAESGGSSYVYLRLIGWINRVSGSIVAFHTYETEGGGLELNWDSPTLDVSLTNTLTTARRTDAVKVPLNFSVTANLNVNIFDASAAFYAWVYCPDQTDLAPSGTAAPLANFLEESTTGAATRQINVRTSATGTIAARATLATVDQYNVSTIGFRWARRN